MAAVAGPQDTPESFNTQALERSQAQLLVLEQGGVMALAASERNGHTTEAKLVDPGPRQSPGTKEK